MRSVISYSLALLLFSPSAIAALATDADSAVSFFRFRNSPFPSGQASRSALELGLLRSEVESAFQISWNKKNFSLEGNRLLRELQVARNVKTRIALTLLSKNRSDASVVKTLPARHNLEILNCDSYWAHVKDNSSKVTGWIPLHLLSSQHSDSGVYINIIDTYLRRSPQYQSPILTTLPRLTRITPLGIKNGFLHIQYNNQMGYVDIGHFVNRADFASLAYHPQENWVTVAYRSKDHIVTKAGAKIPLNEILSYVTSSERAIMVNPLTDSTTPPLGARVDIQKPESYIWGVSSLSGHGQVWWKKRELLTPEKGKIDPTTISTETLLKREIYSIAFESKNSLRGLISSDGIYRTDDGLTWKKIPQFGKQNYPVNIHPNGAWFVGSYKSTNKGKSFEPFIRWDKLAQALESSYLKNPKMLRLTQIESLPNSQIQILVDTGMGRIKLRSNLEGQNWNIVRK